MAVKNWHEHGQHLWAESHKAWSWLRALPAYRVDYNTMKRSLRERVMSNTNNIPPGKTILTAPMQPDRFAERLQKRWGFYPLINPAKQTLPIEFFSHISNLLCADSDGAGVRNKWFNYAHITRQRRDRNGQLVFLKGKALPKLPKRISFEINPKLPIQPALEYIEDFLKDVQRVYEIRPMRPTADRISTIYKAYVMQQLGITEREIRSSLMSDVKNVCPNSLRQSVTRIMKKAKKVSP